REPSDDESTAAARLRVEPAAALRGVRRRHRDPLRTLPLVRRREGAPPRRLAALLVGADRAVHRFEERPLLAADEALRLRHLEIARAFRILRQPRAVGLIRGEALEADERPADVVGPLVRQEVAEQLAAAARDDAAPVARVLRERVALERIDLVT